MSCGTTGEDGRSGEDGLSFIGRVDQNGGDLVFYGFVTAAHDIPSELLFAEGTPPIERNAQAARVTLYASTQITGRSIVENIFNVNSQGTATFYYTDQGADFADPASFQRGEQIAVAALTFENVIIVTAPNTGLSSGSGTFVFDEVESFEIAGDDYELAEDDEHQRLTLIGSGTRLDETAPAAILHVFGETDVIDGD